LSPPRFSFTLFCAVVRVCECVCVCVCVTLSLSYPLAVCSSLSSTAERCTSLSLLWPVHSFVPLLSATELNVAHLWPFMEILRASTYCHLVVSEIEMGEWPLLLWLWTQYNGNWGLRKLMMLTCQNVVCVELNVSL
jgi:hypothetical protein